MNTKATVAQPPEMLYSAYWALSAEGARIGMVTCLRCGTAVLLDDTGATLIHNRWHDEGVSSQREPKA
jgi:hypothetical protein